MGREVHHHSSVVIVEPENRKEFLFSAYDNTYPRKIYRGRATLIGGNHLSAFPDSLRFQKLIYFFFPAVL